jgi:quinohemoprotein ethanol dehydrogenase
VLSTAGNLVFEGTASGTFEAYRADTGERMWSFPAQTGVMAGPVAYTANGEQYVAVLAGWGGVFPLATGEVSWKSGRVRNISRMLAFKLGGKARLRPLPGVVEPVLNPPPSKASAETIRKGEQSYQRFCAACHGDVAVSGGILPDLRYSGTLDSDQWFYVVLNGVLKSNGMVSFKSELSYEDAAAIRAYVIFRAHQSLADANRATSR